MGGQPREIVFVLGSTTYIIEWEFWSLGWALVQVGVMWYILNPGHDRRCEPTDTYLASLKFVSIAAACICSTAHVLRRICRSTRRVLRQKEMDSSNSTPTEPESSGVLGYLHSFSLWTLISLPMITMLLYSGMWVYFEFLKRKYPRLVIPPDIHRIVALDDKIFNLYKVLPVSSTTRKWTDFPLFAVMFVGYVCVAYVAFHQIGTAIRWISQPRFRFIATFALLFFFIKALPVIVEQAMLMQYGGRRGGRRMPRVRQPPCPAPR